MATALMQPELDPLFAKALRLLQSKDPQSNQQLNALVQEQRDKALGIVNKKVNVQVYYPALPSFLKFLMFRI